MNTLISDDALIELGFHKMDNDSVYWINHLKCKTNSYHLKCLSTYGCWVLEVFKNSNLQPIKHYDIYTVEQIERYLSLFNRE